MEQAIDNTVEALCAGLTVLYPTDTIWGVGCDATQPSAVEAVYALKRRDPHKSMLVLAAPEWLEGMAYNEAARMLLGNGRPTTVVMPVTELPFGSMIAANLPADDGTVGVRLPIGSDFCINLLRQFGRPIVSTSANFSGQPSPATYADIDPELIKAVGYAVPSSAGRLRPRPNIPHPPRQPRRLHNNPAPMIYAVKPYSAPLADQRAECRRLLAKLLLEVGIDDPEPTIGHEPNGRPLFESHPDIHISLSHCRSHVAVALSDNGPVGIDVEGRRRVNPALVARVCNAGEQRSIESAADPELEFVRIWTRKEAYLKQLGTGIQGFGSLPDTEARAADSGLVITTIPLGDAYISLCHKPLDTPTSA